MSFLKRRKPSQPSESPEFPLIITDSRRANSSTDGGPIPHVFSSLGPVAGALAEAHAEIKQLKFLLASASMMDAPQTWDAASWFRRVITPFGYIHPKTMAHYHTNSTMLPSMIGGLTVFSGSPTKWILTSLMPEDRVILSTQPVPGLEKILAR